MGDAIVPADPIKQHLPALAEPIRELFTVVRQDFLRDTVATQGLGKRQTHRPAGGADHDRGDDAEPGMVIDTGDDLAFGAIGQHQTANDIDLP